MPGEGGGGILGRILLSGRRGERRGRGRVVYPDGRTVEFEPPSSGGFVAAFTQRLRESLPVSGGLPPPQPLLPGPDVPAPPIGTDVVVPEGSAQVAAAQGLPSVSYAEEGVIRALLARARAGRTVRKAKRARRRGELEMLAQTPLEGEIIPGSRNFPTVPGQPTLPTYPPPDPDGGATPPPRARGRGAGGVVSGVIGTIGLEGIAEGVGAIGGAVAGDVIHGEAIEEARVRNAELERRLREREAQVAAELEQLERGVQLPPGVMRRAQTREGLELERQLERAAREPELLAMPRMRLPPMPQSQTVTPQPGGRARRAVQRVIARARGAARSPLGMGLGGAFLLSDLLGSRQGRDLEVPLPEVSPPEPELEFDPGAAAMPFFGGFAVPGTTLPSSSSRCDCKPKRRGPKRKCLERAPVVFKSGRRRGKAAGTKCLRWQQ